MQAASSDTSVRDRLLIAAAQLLDESGGADVSTRAICDLAGVQAPSLYHHFGSKQGLLDAVVSHGFRRFLAVRQAESPESMDPIGEIRDGWDIHVQFGMRHPAFYAYIYGRVEQGRQCGVVAEVEAMILRTLEPAARQGRLKIPAAAAAKEILAASSGVIMSMITMAGDQPDWDLSNRVRDAILDSLAVDAPDRGDATLASTAVALAAALDEHTPALSPSEVALLKEWLHRLATHAG